MSAVENLPEVLSGTLEHVATVAKRRTGKTSVARHNLAMVQKGCTRRHQARSCILERVLGDDPRGIRRFHSAADRARHDRATSAFPAGIVRDR